MRISAAQRKVSQLGRKKAIAAEDEEALRGPKPQTHSARKPAYAYTPLCPDPELREAPEGVGRVRKQIRQPDGCLQEGKYEKVYVKRIASLFEI